METQKKVSSWVRTMGYNGDMPESLSSICNNSTSFLWENLMENVLPRQEVEKIKGNIILNRLRTKTLEKQDQFPFKIKEIDVYKKKLALEQKLKTLKEKVQEKQYKVEKLSQNCKIKDISLDYVKKRIKENEQRKYLLDRKKQQLETQNEEANEMLTSLKNVTPTEIESSCGSKEITETLEKCATKLKELLKEDFRKVSQQTFKPPPFSTVIQTKRKQHNSSVATYLSIREHTDFEEITKSCVKKSELKENISMNSQTNIGKMEVKKKLFDVPQIINENSEHFFEDSLVHKNFQNVKRDNFKSEAQLNEIQPLNRRSIKRESLGILPDKCFDEVEVDSDIFLQSTSTRSSVEPLSNILNKSIDSFSFIPSNQLHVDNHSAELSNNFNFPIVQSKHTTSQITKNIAEKEESSKRLYGNESINNALADLLHKNNRELVNEVLQKILQSFKVEFTKIISMEEHTNHRIGKVNEDDVAKLQFVHIQTELKVVQQKIMIKDLIAKIAKRKLEILNSIKSQENILEIQEWLDLSIKQIGLDTSLAAIKKEINNSWIVESSDNDDDLKVVSSRVIKAKNEIAEKMNQIRLVVDELYKTQKLLKVTKELVLGPVWHIRMFKTDTDWMKPLLQNLWTKEIEVFENFPLNYSRRCTITDPKTYYRNLCVDNYPSYMNIDPETLEMLSDVIGSPLNLPETILINIIREKMKLDVLKNLKLTSARPKEFTAKYSFEELLKQESYINFAIEEIKSVMFSSNSKQTLAVGDVIKKTMDIWSNMPVKDVISSKRLVEGCNYHYYQNKLNSYL